MTFATFYNAQIDANYEKVYNCVLKEWSGFEHFRFVDNSVILIISTLGVVVFFFFLIIRMLKGIVGRPESIHKYDKLLSSG